MHMQYAWSISWTLLVEFQTPVENAADTEW